MANAGGWACPVCGAAQQDEAKAACPVCGFSHAFIRVFADEAAYAAWQADAGQKRLLWLKKAQRHWNRRPRIAFGRNSAALCTDAAQFYIDGVFGRAEAEHDIRQYSIGDRHTVILHKDGSVAASGENEYWQCNVSGMKEIRAVLAAPGCTYAVRSDGRVQVAGSTGSPTLALTRPEGEDCAVLEGWENIIQLASGSDHLAGLDGEGHIHIGGYPLSRQEEIAAAARQCRKATAIAAAAGYCTLALHEDGTVTFIGPEDDPRRAAEQWKNIAAIAAESSYAVGLTQEGRILLAGSVSRVLDMGRSEAADWQEIVAIACSRSGIGAVALDGELHLAGSIPHRREILEVWNSQLKEEAAKVGQTPADASSVENRN